MDATTLLPILVLVIGFYMAWNIGANDVSNAMGTSVGSGALTLRRAVIVAAILEFSGAFLAGNNVSETMQRGLIDTERFASDPMILVLGMSGALLGTGAWLQIASYFGWPVSTTHAIVGAILGFGGVVGGVDTLQWGEVGAIAMSWIVSPVMAGLVSYTLFTVLQRHILYTLDPCRATRKLFPYLTGLVFVTFTFSLFFKGLQNLQLSISLPQIIALALGVGLLAYGISYLLIRRIRFPDIEPTPPFRFLPQTVVSLEKAMKHLQRVRGVSVDETHERLGKILHEVRDLSQQMRKHSSLSEKTSEYHVVEKMFVYLQILTACFVAFAHGANDVANAIGPLAAVLDILKHGIVATTAPIPSWLLAFGGLGIVVGLATWGWRVIETIGRKITELTPTRGFSAEFGAATTILIASKLGLPISTTHCLVGAVLGVGLAGGIRALNLNMLRDIALSWVITLPASAAMSIAAYYLLKSIFLHGV